MKRAALLILLGLTVLPTTASATPVCTDGFMGGPPASLCGGRIFPEAQDARAYVQYSADPLGFIEYQHGIQYLAQKYPRWISVTSTKERYGDSAISAGGRDIQIIKITDHRVPDEGKETLFYSLSVHGNERGGLEGGLRTAEDLAIAAENGGKLVDGVDNYESSTGRKAVFHELEVRDVLAKEAVYLVDFNPDGWAVGDFWNPPAPALYQRGNANGTDLNRQMPTIGRINPNRNPLEEPEAVAGMRFMREVAAQGVDGLMAYGADIHGEINSQAYMDVMYPAGEFDSVDHRRLMAIAERTKSVIDATLYRGIAEEIENASGGNDAEYARAIPVKPAHWATVWDTLGYTDTGFIGDYLATDLGVTGMDYEIFFNHTVPEKVWNIYLQDNHINASRGIIKTAMAYALFQRREFNADNVKVDPKGRAGFVVNPDTVTDKDANGPGTLPGPERDGIGENGEKVAQAPYEVSNMKWFTDTNRYMPRPFFGLTVKQLETDAAALEQVDSLVVADLELPAKALANVRAWVMRGGNLVLTDRALNSLAGLGVVEKDDLSEIDVYQPFANFTTFEHPLSKGLRPNARQLVESGVIGYGIQGVDEPADQTPMTVVATDAFEAAGGKVVGTTSTVGTGEDPAIDKELDDGSLTSVGELELGKGKVRVVGGALPMPTEENDHRFGLRNYGLTYSGLFLMENSIVHDAPGLGDLRAGADPHGATRELPAAVRGELPCRKRRVKVVVKSRRALKTLTLTIGERTKVLRGKRLARLRQGNRYTVRVTARGGTVIRAVGRNTKGKRPIRAKRVVRC